MSDIAVRKAVAADLGKLQLFDMLSSHDGEARYEKLVWQRGIEDGLVYLVANDKKNPVGFMHLDRRGPALFVNDIFVAEKYRGEGIGRAFMHTACALADQTQKSMKLEVARSNDAAISLYRAFGFAVTGTTASPTHVVMSRELRMRKI